MWQAREPDDGSGSQSGTDENRGALWSPE